MSAIQLPGYEESFWHKAYPERPLYPILKEDMEVDVVIVGAGVTGLTSAYLLKKSGLRVAVLEQRTVGSGTTGRTTGKVTSQHNILYADMTRRLGIKAARAYAEANQIAVDVIGDIIKREKIQCDWQLDDNYVFTVNSRTVESFQEEAKAATALGLPASFTRDTPLPFSVKGAVKFSGQAKINAQKYLLGLAEKINGDGSFVFEQSKVTHFKDGRRPHVETNKATVRAKFIIVATKIPAFPLAARFEYALLEHPTESFGIACRADIDLAGMYISPDSSHHSILPIKVDGQKCMLFVGVGGNTPGVRLSKELRYHKLAQYAHHYFGVNDVVCKWSDMDYLPYDFYPLVGKVYPWSRRMHQATGYMKWGLSNGTAAAMMLHDSLLGRSNSYASYFNSMRYRPILNIPRAFLMHFLERR